MIQKYVGITTKEVFMDLLFVSKTALFRGCSQAEIRDMAQHLHFRTARYKKGAVILSEGTVVTDIGLVLSGSVQIAHHDIWGNKSILGIVEAGGVFAEAYACIPNEPMLLDVVANEDCEILLVNVPSLFSLPSPGAGESRLTQNLVVISAQKNLQLSRRSLHTSPKTIRGRLLSYFSHQISAQGSRTVKIPFDRQQLADYLNLDRSALSKELGKMKRDGILEYRKNVFTFKADL